MKPKITIMKKIVFIISLFFTITVFSQEPTDTIANFKLINKHVIWQKVYKVPGVSKDSLQKVLHFQSGQFNTGCQEPMQLTNSSISYNLHLEIKEGKYRITLSDLVIHGNQNIFGNITFDYFYTKKRGKILRHGSIIKNSLICLDKELQEKFQLPPTTSDW